MVFAVGVASAVVFVGAGCGGGSDKKPVAKSTTTAPGTSAVCKGDEKFDEGNTHLANGTDVTYKVYPPAGGPHWVSPAPDGIYSADQIPPTPPIVHSLEHGYVAIWYRVGVAQADVDALEALARGLKPDVLLVPQKELSVPVAATAWHHRLLCSKPDLAAIKRFVVAWRNQGPEKIPH
jgi:hypothetical protein